MVQIKIQNDRVHSKPIFRSKGGKIRPWCILKDRYRKVSSLCTHLNHFCTFSIDWVRSVLAITSAIDKCSSEPEWLIKDRVSMETLHRFKMNTKLKGMTYCKLGVWSPTLCTQRFTIIVNGKSLNDTRIFMSFCCVRYKYTAPEALVCVKNNDFWREFFKDLALKNQW